MTGFPKYDKLIGGGFRRGTINIIGAQRVSKLTRKKVNLLSFKFFNKKDYWWAIGEDVKSFLEIESYQKKETWRDYLLMLNDGSTCLLTETPLDLLKNTFDAFLDGGQDAYNDNLSSQPRKSLYPGLCKVDSTTITELWGPHNQNRGGLSIFWLAEIGTGHLRMALDKDNILRVDTQGCSYEFAKAVFHKVLEDLYDSRRIPEGD